MGILMPGPQEEDRYELVRADNLNCAIVGTSERMCICYPIAVERNDDGSFNWDYTGGEPQEYDETAEVQTDERGEPLFQDEDGNDVPASMVAIIERDDEGEPVEVGRLAKAPATPTAAPTPASGPESGPSGASGATMPGIELLLLPYKLTPSTDDATILAHVGRWLDLAPAEVRQSLERHFRAHLPEES